MKVLSFFSVPTLDKGFMPVIEVFVFPSFCCILQCMFLQFSMFVIFNILLCSSHAHVAPFLSPTFLNFSSSFPHCKNVHFFTHSHILLLPVSSLVSSTCLHSTLLPLSPPPSRLSMCTRLQVHCYPLSHVDDNWYVWECYIPCCGKGGKNAGD